MKSFILITAVLLGIGFSATAKKRVCGKVCDSKGEPLCGVTVVIKNSKIGIVTDFDGDYCLDSCSSNSVLIFSMIGMETEEVRVDSLNSIDVSLKEDLVNLSGSFYYF